MTNEFKKISKGKETRYILESASVGATGSGAVSTVSQSTKGIITREGNKPTKVPQKPRQGPLRPQTGAGRHQDKKKDEKQGKAKHKKPFYEEVKEELGQLIAELKNTPNPDPKKISHFQQLLQKQKDRFSQQGFSRAAHDTEKLQKQYREPISELEKPSGTLYIILLKDRTESVRVIGDFGTFPAEVQARASKVGIKDKEGRKERPLKVNFLMTSASQALAELDKALADVDFIGGEKAEFVFKNSAFETDIEAEVQELQDLISSGADERFEVYDDERSAGTEPPRKLKGVDHYIVDPVTGEKEKVKKPGKPDRQLGGHSVQQPKTYTYRLQRTDLAPKLRDMGFKFDGNNIILSKQQRDQLLAKMGDKQFGMIFGQGDRFAEGQEGSDENYMNQTVSDLHREIYGFGPGKQFVYEWQKMSYEEKANVYNKLMHLAGKVEEARYGRNHNPDSYSGHMPATDKIPQDSTASQAQQQAMVDQMKQRTINRILKLKPGWGHSDLELMTAAELNQILRDIQGQSEGAQKKPNATTRHLRDYPVSDKDMAKPVKKPEKKKPEQGVAEGERKLGPAPGQSTPNQAERAKSRDHQRTDAAKKARDASQRKGLKQDKDGTYYAKEGVAEGKEELHAQLQSINQKLKLMRGGPVGEPNSVAFVEKRKALLKQKEQILSQLKQGVSEGSGKNVVKSVKVGNFRHDLVDTGMGWQVRIYNGDELYDTGMSKNSEQKGLAALEDAVAYTEKQTRTKRQGVSEGWGFDQWGHDTWTDAQKEVARKKKYEMMLSNGKVKRFTAKDDADAKRIAKGHGAKSVIKMKGDLPGNKIAEQSVAEGSDKLQGTPVVSLKDLGDKDNKKNKYGQNVPKKLQKDDSRVKFHKDTKQGVAEGSLETDNMVSHIGQIIQSIYPRGGDKNTYMKLVAQQMPHVVRDNPKLFRRAFGMAYDRFFHIDQDNDFDYTDYSMRKGERGMEEGSKRCPQCGSTNCTCPPGKCNCKPVKGWLAKKEVDEEKQRLDPSCWKGYKKQGTKMKGGVRVNNCVPKEDTYIDSLSDRLDEIMEDWQKVNKKDKTDGMSQKAVNAYRRENPGSKLKTAVTTKPSKLKKGSKSAKRRKSFCSRMSGMKKAHASAKTKRDPDSPINKALRRWNCEESVQLDELKITQLPYKGQKQEKKAPFAFGSKHIGAAGGKGTSKGKLSGLGAATRKDGGKPVVKAEEGFGSKLAGLGLAAAAMMPGQADARVNIDDPNSYRAPAPIVQQQKIDYTKPGPVSKDSMGQKLEYGIPVTPEGKFKAPNQDLPDDEYAQQLKAYKSWKADFMSRWPDAVWNSDGSAKSNIKPGLAPVAPGYKPGSGQGLAPVFPGAQKESYIDDLNSMLENILGEKAPPGDKYERMVKHIKKGYAKDGKLSDKERGIAYATAWKAKNKAKK